MAKIPIQNDGTTRVQHDIVARTALVEVTDIAAKDTAFAIHRAQDYVREDGKGRKLTISIFEQPGPARLGACRMFFLDENMDEQAAWAVEDLDSVAFATKVADATTVERPRLQMTAVMHPEHVARVVPSHVPHTAPLLEGHVREYGLPLRFTIPLLVSSRFKAEFGGGGRLEPGEAWIGVTRPKAEVTKGAQVVQRAADENLEGVALKLLVVARAKENNESVALYEADARDLAALRQHAHDLA